MKQYRTLVLSLLSTAAVMGLIIYFSAQTSETSHGLSRHLANRLLELLRVAEPETMLGLVNWGLRKTAHFMLYLVLGLCLYPAAAQQRKLPPAALVFLAGMLFAASDEFHQCFTQGRTPSLADVLIDTCGVLTGVSLGLPLHKRKGKERK